MTVNAALTAGEEHEAGRIAVGHRADLTVLADDPLTTAATDLPELPVLLTVLDGAPHPPRPEHLTRPVGRPPIGPSRRDGRRRPFGPARGAAGPGNAHAGHVPDASSAHMTPEVNRAAPPAPGHSAGTGADVSAPSERSIGRARAAFASDGRRSAGSRGVGARIVREGAARRRLGAPPRHRAPAAPGAGRQLGVNSPQAHACDPLHRVPAGTPPSPRRRRHE
ncbi:amidohydrolase family protein [Streptomyces sp. NPDC005262]|uniref:amidohydrolase family protein n=1 Tax=Streptomyces sp. NPDC005262 TaxID=3364710 RepID=UPI0036C3A908